MRPRAGPPTPAAAKAVVVAATVLGVASAVGAALGPRYGGELRIATGEVPAGIEPGVPRATAQKLLASLVHETLLGIDDDGRPRPGLAESWATAAEGREWTLRLAAATFHDNTPVTAADGVRAVRRFLRSGSVAGAHLARVLDGGDPFRHGVTDALPGVTAGDDRRVVLRFRLPTALPLATLASPAAAVVSARGAGAGPFVPTTPPSARGVSATAFGRHVRGRPFVDVVRVLSASADRGGVDAADVASVSPSLPEAVGLLMLVLDPGAGPLADRRMRALIASSVDRMQLARHFLPGGEAAEVLLTAALLPPWPGPGPGPRPPVATLSGRVALRVAADVPPSASQRVVAHLAAVGLDVQAIPMPAAAAAAVTGQPRLVVWYPEVAEPGLALEELAALSGSPAEVRDALEAADAERDADRRRAALQRAEESLRGNQVLVPLARVPLPFGPRPGVHGLRTSASGTLIVEDAWMEP